MTPRRVKIANVSRLHRPAIPRGDLGTEKTKPNIEKWPESLGGMLIYWTWAICLICYVSARISHAWSRLHMFWSDWRIGCRPLLRLATVMDLFSLLIWLLFQTTWWYPRGLFLLNLVLHPRAYVCIIYETTKGKFPEGHHRVWVAETKHTS